MLALTVNRLLALVMLVTLTLPPITYAQNKTNTQETRSEFPTNVSQGALVIGTVPAGSRVEYSGQVLRVDDKGQVVFGVGRNETGPLILRIQTPKGTVKQVNINVTTRQWPLEVVNGVPPKTVNPPPAIAARITREQAQITDARQRNDARSDFAQAFIWPVQGRISGRFGSARIYNGQTAGNGHSGMDIATATGTPVKAPAAGVITFAAPYLYLTGGTVLLDHGAGVSSNFLHLSRIDVKAGDHVGQGQVIGAVGATGRATGPHLHWGMNWFNVRIDPMLILERTR
ncbi:M23 family metallopeptidase [Xylella fastidiosa subsp. multiplex]|uniref:M23 family metallopeptidase n=1 Tax=Xylella fastidiosa TaxID=2371 RepID=UPI001892A034|nr:M23 family metallopeptidase [Xylella fastidiosa]QPC02482.1 M23 family metallopeptidase [Xylella fastidiosa subsp. multiplex]